MLSLCRIDLQGRLSIQEIVHEMLNELSINHVFNESLSFIREFVPELEVLPELCPASRHCGRQKGEQIVQELEDWVIIMGFDRYSFSLNCIGDDLCQEIGH